MVHRKRADFGLNNNSYNNLLMKRMPLRLAQKLLRQMSMQQPLVMPPKQRDFNPLLWEPGLWLPNKTPLLLERKRMLLEHKPLPLADSHSPAKVGRQR